MTTTIKVTNELRDRLKVQAERNGLTLGGHLARLADAEDRAVRMAALGDAIRRTPPELMRSWQDEAEEWERTSLSDLDR